MFLRPHGCRIAEQVSLRDSAARQATARTAAGAGKHAAGAAAPPASQRPEGAAATAAAAEAAQPRSPPAPRVVIVQRSAPTTPARAKPAAPAQAGTAAATAKGKPASSKDHGSKGAKESQHHAAAAEEEVEEEMRIVSYYGDWVCFCGHTNRLWDTCVCGQIPPCRCVAGRGRAPGDGCCISVLRGAGVLSSKTLCYLARCMHARLPTMVHTSLLPASLKRLPH